MRLRFGPFLFDDTLGRLSGAGGEIRLRPKTSELLALLIERSPELVRHDDLVEGVWQGRALSDAVLAQAISELRGALGDDARQPRFIETMHRRGYRFIHPVEPIEGDGPPREALGLEPADACSGKAEPGDVGRAAAESPSLAGAAERAAPSGPATPASADPAISPATAPRRRLAGAVGLAVAALLALVVALSWVPRAPAPEPAVEPAAEPPQRVAFVPLRAGEPSPQRWPEVLLEMTRNQLEQRLDAGGEVDRVLLPYDRVARLRRSLGELETIADSPAASVFLGADHLVLGSVGGSIEGSDDRREPASLELTVRLWRAQGSAELASWNVAFLPERPDSALSAALLVAEQLSQALPWPLRQGVRTRQSAETACWRDWILALDAAERADFASAAGALERACAACPGSADLRHQLAVALGELGRGAEAAEAARLAAAMPGRDPWRRRWLERRLAGDTLGALGVGRRHLRGHPSSAEARLAVAELHLELGQRGEATAVLDHPSVDADPHFAGRRAALLVDGGLPRPAGSP